MRRSLRLASKAKAAQEPSVLVSAQQHHESREPSTETQSEKSHSEESALIDGTSSEAPVRRAPRRQPRASASDLQGRSASRRPLKPAEKSGLDGDALMLTIKSIPDTLERWQLAASLALAGGFGTGFKEFLEPFWLDEAQRVFSVFTRPPFRSQASKKAAAKIAKISSIENLPLTVPPEVVGLARSRLLKIQVERELEELERQENSENLDSRITLTRAKAEYHLNDDDIADLDCIVRRNPHYRSAAPMCLYILRDIIREAYLKHGGAAGLAAARAKSEVRKARLRETKMAKEEQKHAKRQQRKEELVAALTARGLHFRNDSTVCEEYINETSTKSLQTVVDIMHEMNFYFNHTKYAHFHDLEYDEWCDNYSYGPPDAQDKYEMSFNAKSRALSALIEKIGVQGVLAIPNLPPTIRRRFEGRGE